jgi:ElaA protein
MSDNKIEWQFLSFSELDKQKLYEIIKARLEVYVVEQNAIYQDCDDLDQISHHLIGWSGKEIVAYLRIVPPGKKFEEPAIARVIIRKQFRGSGLGKELMQLGIRHCRQLFPGQGIRISAQQYLEKFYNDLGFKTVAGPYDEAGIAHLEMLISQ